MSNSLVQYPVKTFEQVVNEIASRKQFDQWYNERFIQADNNIPVCRYRFYVTPEMWATIVVEPNKRLDDKGQLCDWSGQDKWLVYVVWFGGNGSRGKVGTSGSFTTQVEAQTFAFTALQELRNK